MKRKKLLTVLIVLGCCSGLAFLAACSPPPKAEPVKTASIPDDAYPSGGLGQGLSVGV